MLDLRNRTPFRAALLPGLDKEGRSHVTVLVKGTFALGAAEDLAVAEEQQPIAHADSWWGEPGASSIRHPSDACPARPGTGVLLIGHAYAPGGRAAGAEVALAAGPLRKVVRVVGDRAWYRAVGDWAASDPRPFDRLPLVYERAFGGTDVSDPDPAKHGAERRNPVGAGFASAARLDRVEGLRLPNLEAPAAPITRPRDRPAPAGFGAIGRDWLPRVSYAGTYDDRWSAERCPFLPEDFDDRYFLDAPPDLVATPHLAGGEPVHVAGASEGGDLRFRIPAFALEVTMRRKRVTSQHRPVLDGVVIEPDERRVVLTWRATVPCGRELLHIERVSVTARAA